MVVLSSHALDPAWCDGHRGERQPFFFFQEIPLHDPDTSTIFAVLATPLQVDAGELRCSATPSTDQHDLVPQLSSEITRL